MSIVNLHNPQKGGSLSIYKVRYGDYPLSMDTMAEKEHEVNVLAPNVDGAVALFAAFYQTRTPNPREMTAASEEARKNCQSHIRSIDCLTVPTIVDMDLLGNGRI